MVKAKGKARILIDFSSQEAAVEWFKELRSLGLLPEESALFVPDGIDETAVTHAKRLIVRGTRDPRPESSRVA